MMATRGKSRFVVAGAVAVLLMAPGAVRAEGSAEIEITILVAAKGKGPRVIDPRLGFKRELYKLPFREYKFFGTESHSLSAGGECGVELPGGAYLHITSTESTPEHLKMHVLVNQHNRPVLNTTVRINRNNAAILLTGPSTATGRVLVRIMAKNQGGDGAQKVADASPASAEAQ